MFRCKAVVEVVSCSRVANVRYNKVDGVRLIEAVLHCGLRQGSHTLVRVWVIGRNG